MGTRKGVFILESLDFDDESERRMEGSALSHVLALVGRPHEYQYIRTREELRRFLRKFHQSQLRYLHLSCHGNPEALFLTLGRGLGHEEFARLASRHLGGRRLFISSCDAVHDELAEQLSIHTKLRSVVGPSEDIGFNDATVAWAGFYNLVFREEKGPLSNKAIEVALRKICRAFSLQFNAYFRLKESGRFRKVEIH